MTTPIRMKRKTADVPSEARTPKRPITVLPGTNWVCERRNEDGTITVLPLIGWEIVDGEPHPLPRSLGAEWLVRPMAEGDERQIRTSAARLRPEKTTPNLGNWSFYR